MASREWLTDAVRELLGSFGVRYDFYEYEEEEVNVFRMNFPLECELSSTIEEIFVYSGRIYFINTLSIKASSDRYNDVVEYLTRANHRFLIGGFKFDYSTGRISFRNGIRIGGEISKRDFARHLEGEFRLSRDVMNEYADGIVKSLMGYGTPEANIASVESRVGE